MQIGERKLKILSCIVELYILTGDPVGSKAIAQLLDFSVSSATVRNEMSELSELGLLEQPHKSAGRIPSELGYRVYINKLMDLNKAPISKDEKELINNALSMCSDDPEHLLEEASLLLADITRCTSVLTSPKSESVRVRKLDFVKTGRRFAMTVLMTSTIMVKNKLFKSDFDITAEILKVFYTVLNQKFKGKRLIDINRGLIQTVAAEFGDMAMIMPSVLESIYDVANSASKTDVKLEGETNLLFFNDFDSNKVKQILNFLNRRDKIAKLFISNNDKPITVLIGDEISEPELSDLSVIMSRYSVDDKSAGSIGIIGPTRIDYAKSITSLSYITSTVEKMLSKMLDSYL